MSDDKPWREDAKILTRGSDDEEQLLALMDAAGEHAKAGNLDAAAKPLEEFRRRLVHRNHFRSYDNDIWVFTDIINCLKRLSPENLPPKSFQRFIEAIPSGSYSKPMPSFQKAFWYGDPDAQFGGDIRLVP